MSKATTDTVTAIKKITIEVRSILTTLHLLREDIKTIRDQSESYSSQAKSPENQRDAHPNQEGGVSSEPENLNINDSCANKAQRAKNTKKYWNDFSEEFYKEIRKPAFLVSTFTLFFVAAYTILTLWLLQVSRRTFDSTVRPYIGDEGIHVMYFWTDEHGVDQRSSTFRPEAKGMAFAPDIKNFGPVPGSNFVARWKLFLGDRQMYGPTLPDTPTTLYPTQIVNLKSEISGEDYRDVMNNSKVFYFLVTISYDGPSGHYTECQKQQYSPEARAFLVLGECPDK